MTVTFDHQLRLQDGRVLSYAECGDPRGAPLFHFHGTPSSRFELVSPELDQAAARLGVRLVLPERPGFGRSDFQPQRRLLDWPADVLALADALQLERFAVTGYSGGAPYAAACAYQIPDRLAGVGIISGVGPLEKPADDLQIGKTDRQLCWLARRSPWLLTLVMAYMAGEIRRKPDQLIRELEAEVSEPDKAALARAEIQAAARTMVTGAFERGGRGCAWDYVVTVRPWGFRLADIRVPVLLWHGELDQICSVGMGRKVASAIPHCQAVFLEDEGHFSLINNHFAVILRAVIGGN